MFWQNHPLIRLVIPFTMGMIGANLFISHMNVAILFILCCMVLAFSFFLIKTSNNYKDGKFGFVAMILFLLIGMTLYTGKHQHITNSIPTDTTFCRGILTERPKEKAHSWALQLEQKNGTLILLYVGKNTIDSKSDSILFTSLQLGDTIVALTKHLTSTLLCKDETFKTYNTYLFHQCICATAYTPSGHWRVLPCRTKRPLLMCAKAFQEQLHDIYNDHGIQGEAGSIIEAMTIGRKTDLSKETRNTYAHAGISHILALSGFHVGIIVLMIQVFFFKHILPLRWRWISNILIIATLWCYALLTGLSPSLVRATTMFTILLLCQSFTHEIITSNSCVLAFFIMLCINPFYLHDIGFQLSFTAVGAIGLLGKRLIKLYSSPNNVIHYTWLITMVAISFISTVFTAPLVAHYFGQFTLISLISNLVLFPLVYLLLVANVFWWAFLWYDPINSLLTDVLNWTATTMNTLTEHIASLPFATIEWHPGIFTTLLFYVMLLTITYFINKAKPSR